jgi:hypothetical protein
MNSYFIIVLLAVILFYVVWSMGWLLERLSYTALNTARNPGSRAWQLFVGPGVALHESSHALGCLFTRTPIVEFKPLNVSVEDDQVVLGYVKYRKPQSELKNAIINLAPVAVSLILLTFVALPITYLVSPGLGGQGLDLIFNLINMKNSEVLLADVYYPLNQIGGYVYTFFYTLAGLTVINPMFWIVAFLAMTIMLSNAPSRIDIENAKPGLKVILLFDIIWLIIAYIFPIAGWILYGVFELLAVLFTLALAFVVVAYGFFIMITALALLRAWVRIIPIATCLSTGFLLWYLNYSTPAFQTMVSLGAFVAITVPLVLMKSFRVQKSD